MVTVEELAAEVAALQKRVAASETVLAIQALKARYGELVDRRFSAGAVVDATTLAGVADAVAAPGVAAPGVPESPESGAKGPVGLAM